MTDDVEYLRLWRLRASAIERGDTEAAIAYGWAAIRRGDELIAAGGGSVRFAPMADAIEEIRRQ